MLKTSLKRKVSPLSLVRERLQNLNSVIKTNLSEVKDLEQTIKKYSKTDKIAYPRLLIMLQVVNTWIKH